MTIATSPRGRYFRELPITSRGGRITITPELKTRIDKLTLEQAKDLLVYICGYVDGDRLVEQAMDEVL